MASSGLAEHFAQVWGSEQAQALRAESVDNMQYYGGTACAEYIEKQELGRGFCIGNAIKYLWRVGNKPGVSIETDLRKAHWYLERVSKVEGEQVIENPDFKEAVEALEAFAERFGISFDEQPNEPAPNEPETSVDESEWLYSPEPDENGDVE